MHNAFFLVSVFSLGCSLTTLIGYVVRLNSFGDLMLLSFGLIYLILGVLTALVKSPQMNFLFFSVSSIALLGSVLSALN